MNNETQLWQAVINQALLDATSRLPNKPDEKQPALVRAHARNRSPEQHAQMTARNAWKSCEGKYEAALKQQTDARKWFESNSRDFKDVCEAAGYDHSVIHAKAQALAVEGWPRKIFANKLDV